MVLLGVALLGAAGLPEASDISQGEPLFRGPLIISLDVFVFILI